MRRGNRGNRGVALLALQVMSVGLEHIPPVTLATLILCTVLYLGLIPQVDYELGAVCISLQHFVPRWWLSATPSDFFSVLASPSNLHQGLKGLAKHHKRLSSLKFNSLRFVATSFFHVDDMHLYYNMVSWLWKARTIELGAGSEYLALLLFTSVVMTNLFYLALSLAALGYATLSGDSTLLSWLGPGQCAVGLSGVIFFLKMVLTKKAGSFPEHHGGGGFGGFPFMMINQFLRGDGRHAVWLEVLLIQFLIPHVSFTAHLAGVVAGYFFCHLGMHERLLVVAEEFKEMRLRFG